MRTITDRIRHTILFEIIALLIAVPCAAWFSGHSISKVGPLAIFFSVFAMTWNFGYNWMVDLVQQKYFKTSKRTLTWRLAHALGFELGLLIPGVFVIAWWLQIDIIAALVMDIGFALFFLFYALIYNWCYDCIFPDLMTKAGREKSVECSNE